MRKVIIISSIDSKTHYQMHHQLALSFENNGDQVLFVENTGVRSPNFRDFGRLKDRLVNWGKSFKGFKWVSRQICLYYPLVIPMPGSRLAGFINNLIVGSAIKRWLAVSPGEAIVFITFLPNSLSLALVRSISFDLTVYYCANDMRGPDGQNKIRILERNLIQRVDLVYAISNKLFEYISSIRVDVKFYPPGVDFLKLRRLHANVTEKPAELNNIKTKIVGYFGAVGPVFNIELLRKLALGLKDVTFVIIGPCYRDIAPLLKIENIFFIGEKPHDQLSNYANYFDCAIVPYLVNEYTDSVYSCKLHEFLAFGLPVVSTSILQHRIFSSSNPGLIELAQTHEDFLVKLTIALDSPYSFHPDFVKRRLKQAESNDWDLRFREISVDINMSIERCRRKPITLFQRLKHSYIWGDTLRQLVVVSFLGFFLLFYSPLVPWLGSYLVLRDPIVTADAVVVFSGDANVSYNNFSFQERVLDSIVLYKNGYVNFIILASGRDRIFKETDIMYLLLVEQGVPASSIFRIEGTRRTTFENVIAAGKLVESKRFTRVNFITSPYHSRRASLIWNKNFPELKVYSPIVFDTPSEELRWGVTLAELRVIIYEFLAILHNRMLGRL